MNQPQFEAALKELVEKADTSPNSELRCAASILCTLLGALAEGSTYTLAGITAAFSVDMIARLSGATSVAPTTLQ